MSFIINLRNPHWLGESEDQKDDLCLHANVYLQINEEILDPGTEKVWCVSAVALRLMRSLIANHFSGEEQHLLHCCGHMMISKNDGTEVDIIGCSNGVDFTVLHCGSEIELITEESKSFTVLFEEYKEGVLAFAESVELFYLQSEDRHMPEDSFDKTGYEAFWFEWKTLKDKIKNFNPQTHQPPAIDFSDYITIINKSVIDINKKGINYKAASGITFISFSECAFNYRLLNGGNGKCIGEIDRTGSAHSLVFYTAPLTTHIFFMKNGKLLELLHPINDELNKMINKIALLGYSLSEEY